ncbi:hypothetical protein [Oceanobacillus neutriphilus]|uniref:Uncharacterized protein n=1 Tax=Oceanobacillus neutriphilus TaxID=531815 RepID=A0ABQ2NPR1_9BACI|nr:hypothetical protein [Oceanobacillus neutriphilus]GGP07295.1 hypothetical protein GCM10011346_02710 [Oceanobacillus neutriphilus]
MDFQQAKRRKERGQTNEEFLNMVFENIKDFDEITITVRQPDGEIETWYSQDSDLSILGMLEVAKGQKLREMEV